MGKQIHRCARWRSFVALLAGVVSVRCAAQGNPSFQVIRERVLGFDMRLAATGPFHSAPYTAKFGLVWSRTIIHPSAVTAVRVHVQIARAETRTEWSVTFKDLQGREVDGFDRHSPMFKAGDVWSDEIPGRGARVEVLTNGDPEGLDLVVDQYAYRTDATYPQGIVGKDDRLPVGSAPRNVQTWGGPVARLRFMVPGGGQALCTGFLITDNWLLTNEHCIRTSAELLSAVAEFGYDTYGSSPDRFRAEDFVVTPSAGLDYSLIRLAGRPAQKYGKVTLKSTEALPENFALVIIQHPAGQPKQVSIADCQVSGARRRGTGDDLTDFGHRCDTLGGSSGSPVLDFQTGAVVGLHHLGFAEGNRNPVNQAVYLSLILRDLQARFPEVYQAISKTAR